MKLTSLGAVRTAIPQAIGKSACVIGSLALVISGPAFAVPAAAPTGHFGSYETTVVPSGLKTPNGIGVDASGNVYIPDTWNKRVLKETLSGGTYTQTLVGTGWVNPHNVAIDASGNLYIVDSGLTTVVMETPGPTGYTQSTIGSGFSGPFGIAVDSGGNLYVADTGNNQIVELSPSGNKYKQTTLFTGLNGPGAIAVDGSGNLYIADTQNKRILIETLASGSYTQSQMNVPGLDLPYGIAVDQNNNVYIVDTYNNRVFLETLSAGTYTQSVIPTSTLYYPYGVAVDPNDNVYIADTDNNRVIKETTSGINFGTSKVGTPTAALALNFVFDTAGTLATIAVETGGTTALDFENAGTGTCTTGTAYTAGATCSVNVEFTPLFAGMRYGAVDLEASGGAPFATAFLYGNGTAPQVNFFPGTQSVVGSGLSGPEGVAIDTTSNSYVADTGNNRLLKVTLSGTQTTLVTGLNHPTSVAVDGAGNLYIADNLNSRVLKESLSVTSYTQSVIASSSAGGLNDPYGVAVDGNGNLFITDTSNSRIVKMTWAPTSKSYTLSVVASNSTTPGMNHPAGIAVDGNDNFYVVDETDNKAFMGTLSAGAYTLTELGSGLSSPHGIAVDPVGNVYIADTSNDRLVKESPSNGGFTQSTVPTTGLGNIYGVTVGFTGDIEIADASNNQVIKDGVTDAPSLSFDTTAVGSTSSDSPQTVTVENVGNAALTIPAPKTGSNPSIAANFTLTSGGTSDCPLLNAGGLSAGTLAAGASCQLPISFTPTAAGTLSGTLVLTDNKLNAAAPNYASQTIKLSGASTLAVPIITWATPIAITYGTALSAAQLDATASVAGSFVYTQAIGTVLGAGSQTLSVTFTPTNTAGVQHSHG